MIFKLKNFKPGICLILIFIFFLFVPVHFTQSDEMYFKHITVDQGLSQNTIRAIIQDKKGFIWAGTQEGLNRYDGYNFKVYEHNPNDEKSLSENFILSLFESSNGEFWIGTNGGGLNKFDRESETFVHYVNDPDDPESLSNNFVFDIYEDRSGILWIGTYTGLNKFDRTKDAFERFYPNTGIGEQNTILEIYEDNSAEFWIGTQAGGLYKFNRNTGKWTQFLYDPDSNKSLSNNNVTAIFEDSYGEFWVGTLGGGLNKLDKDLLGFTRMQNIPEDKATLSSNIVQTIYKDTKGTLWIGTLGGGISKYNRNTNTFERIINNPDNPVSLNNNYIYSIIEDRSGAYWIGTGGGGINKYNKQNSNFIHYRINPFAPAGSNENFVWCIAENKTGNLWIGTQGAGLYHLNKRTGKIINYINDYTNPNSISNNIIHSLAEDKEGVLWIGTNGGGLNKLIREKSESGNKYKFIRYGYDPFDSNSLGSNQIKKVFVDSDGIIWLGTYGGGLNRFNSRTGKFKRYLVDPNNPSSIASNYVIDIYEDKEGKLWIGTWGGGLQNFNKTTEIFTTYSFNPEDRNSISHNRIDAIYEDDSGVLWVGTDYGLNKFNRETNTFIRYSKKDGLSSNVVYSILQDDNKNIWVSTNQGLSMLDISNNRFINYNVLDGLQSNEFNGGSYLETRKGELLFGGINGITIFNPAHFTMNEHIPPVVITSFKRFNEEVKIQKSISETEVIELSYSNNTFSFEFAALDYLNPNKNKYAYMLEGYDNDWIYSGSSRVASYTQVPPGEYIFKVKGSNNDGIWNETGTSISIIIIPPFWQTIWFRSLLLIAFISTLYYLYRYRLRKLELKRVELQDRVTERTQAAEKLQNALTQVEDLRKRLEAENIYLQNEIKLQHNFEHIITKSDIMIEMLRKVEKVSSTDATVLIMGESGTGKELVARAIHNISDRGDRPLVKVNCSALPPSLIESELFGHEKGAFTGALSRKIGRFELANGGTIFLDEIGDLPLELQPKILRILQEGEFERVGNPETIKVDVRIIAATNRDLNMEIEKNNFREDLYYRLNVFPIVIPPLRERKEDISLLASYFVKKFNAKIGKEEKVISQGVMELLEQYQWPGNVRELENIIERAVITSDGKKLVIRDWLKKHQPQNGNSEVGTLEEVEKQHIIKALEKTSWQVGGEKGAARLLGLKRTTLEARMKKLNITKKKE